MFVTFVWYKEQQNIWWKRQETAIMIHTNNEEIWVRIQEIQ